MEIPGAPIDQLDCCEAQQYHVGHRGSICFEKPPAVKKTETTTSVIGKCRFCEHTIVVERNTTTQAWTVRSSAPS